MIGGGTDTKCDGFFWVNSSSATPIGGILNTVASPCGEFTLIEKRKLAAIDSVAEHTKRGGLTSRGDGKICLIAQQYLDRLDNRADILLRAGPADSRKPSSIGQLF